MTISIEKLHWPEIKEYTHNQLDASIEALKQELREHQDDINLKMDILLNLTVIDYIKQSQNLIKKIKHCSIKHVSYQHWDANSFNTDLYQLVTQITKRITNQFPGTIIKKLNEHLPEHSINDDLGSHISMSLVYGIRTIIEQHRSMPHITTLSRNELLKLEHHLQIKKQPILPAQTIRYNEISIAVEWILMAYQIVDMLQLIIIDWYKHRANPLTNEQISILNYLTKEFNF